MAIVKRILSRLNPQSRDSGQQSAQSHHIDKPVDGSINKPEEKPVERPVGRPVEKPVEESIEKLAEKSAEEWESIEESIKESVKESTEESIEESAQDSVDGSASKPMDGPVNEPVSTQFTLEVTVIPVCENYDTPTRAISKGLVWLSKAMNALNSIPSVKKNPDEAGTMASFIINGLNIMATVPDRDRPESIYSYHVYATRTDIATFLNIMGIIIKHRPKEGYSSPTASNILEHTSSAFLYFGIVILRTPAPLSAHIAAAIGVEVRNTSSHTSALSPEKAYSIAKELTRILAPNVPRPGNQAPEQITTPRQTDIRPLVSIFTSDQLAGLARRMAHSVKTLGGHEPEDAAKWLTYKLLKLDLDVPPHFCPCREESNRFPICLCGVEPYSLSTYEKSCTWKLLPIII